MFLNFQRSMSILTSVAAVSFLQAAPNPDNLIKNGTFDKDFAGWIYSPTHGSAPKGSVVDGRMVCEITKLGNGVQVNGQTVRTYDVQFYQIDLSLQQGKTYILSFEAKSDSLDRALQIAVENQGNPGQLQYCVDAAGKNYIEKLTTTMQTFIKIFKMTKSTDNAVRLNFNFGDATPTVYFDNIILIDSTKATALRPRWTSIAESRNSPWIAADSRGLSFSFSDPVNCGFKIYSLSGKVVASTGSFSQGSAVQYRVDYRSLGIPSGRYVAQAFNGHQRSSKIFSVMP
jgi:hypothetical protein